MNQFSRFFAAHASITHGTHIRCLSNCDSCSKRFICYTMSIGSVIMLTKKEWDKIAIPLIKWREENNNGKGTT